MVINSVQFSTSNYVLTWKLLCDRFDNKYLLIQHHVTAIFLVIKESSANLKNLIDLINKNLRALLSFGEPVNQWYPID